MMQTKSVKIVSTAPDLIAWLFIFLWVYAAVSKLLDYQKFTVQLGQSPLLMPIAGFVSWFIPFLELLIALLLFIPAFRLIGFYCSFGLMMAFTAYIIMITRFSDFIPCSCGGVLQKMSWDQHLVFNGCVVLCAIVGVVISQTNESRFRDNKIIEIRGSA